MRENGFECRERVASGPTELVVVGDPELTRRIGQCRQKLAEHQGLRQTYETWARALAGQARREPDAQLVLRIDDIVFFGL